MKIHTFKPSTVSELILKLQTLPSDLPVYIRTKYTGNVLYCDDVAVNVRGVSEMHPEDEPKNVTFLV